jgi:hypothetical protein
MCIVWWMAVVLVVGIAWLRVQKPKEQFTVEFKTSIDGGIFKTANKGASQIMKNMRQQANNVSHALVSSLPFKEKLRRWQRERRRKNM